MFRSLITLVAISLALTVSCHSSESRASTEHRYTLVVLRKGPKSAEKTIEERAAIMAGHMANIHRLGDEGVLLVAGPFGDPNPDPTRRGVFVFDVDDMARAQELANTDPGVQAGVFAVDLYSLTTRADLHVAQTEDRRVVAEAKAAGKDPNANFPMHTYTFAIIGGGDRTQHALESLAASSKPVLVARMGPDHCLAILDTADIAQAERFLAPVRADLGELDLSPWWASASLLKLAPAAR